MGRKIVDWVNSFKETEVVKSNLPKVAKAVSFFNKDAAQWVELWDDAKVDEYCDLVAEQSDKLNMLDNGLYAQRLSRLLKDVHSVNGKPLDIKVYISDEINAFAWSNSIRVYSGLMDIMRDNELMAIIGHEVGHIVHHDVRKQMRSAIASTVGLSSLQKWLAAKPVSSYLASFLSDYLKARYSRQQEDEADEYGIEFVTSQGYSADSMADALDRLVEQENGERAPLIERMLSSHPETKDRARRLREMGDRRIRFLKGEY